MTNSVDLLKNIKIISFDIGNTLINLENTIGFSSYFCQQTGCLLDDIRPIINKCFLINNMSMKEAIIEACNLLSINVFETLLNGYIQLEPVLFEDVIPTLKYLLTKGYTIIACSNCTKWDAENENVDLKKYVNYFFYSYKLGVVKPDKLFFDKVCYYMNVTGTQILHIGDTLNADCFGALHAGWNTIFLDRKKSVSEIPDYILTIHSLTQLIDILV